MYHYLYLERAAEKEPPPYRRLFVASKRAASLKVRGVLLRFAALVGKSGVRIRLKGLEVLDS